MMMGEYQVADGLLRPALLERLEDGSLVVEVPLQESLRLEQTATA